MLRGGCTLETRIEMCSHVVHEYNEYDPLETDKISLIVTIKRNTKVLQCKSSKQK